MLKISLVTREFLGLRMQNFPGIFLYEHKHKYETKLLWDTFIMKKHREFLFTYFVIAATMT